MCPLNIWMFFMHCSLSWVSLNLAWAFNIKEQVLLQTHNYIWVWTLTGPLQHMNMFSSVKISTGCIFMMVVLLKLSWLVQRHSKVHPSYQLWPDSMCLLRKSIPTAWHFHHHVSIWGKFIWCVFLQVYTWRKTSKSKKNYHFSWAPSSTCFLFLLYSW